MSVSLPCPYCGCNYIKMYGNSSSQQTYCMNCKARGPAKETQEEAALAWRKVPDLLARLMEKENE